MSLPEVPEDLTEGATKQEALVEAKGYFIAALGGYIEARHGIPLPSARKGYPLVVSPALIAAKVALPPDAQAKIRQFRISQAGGDHGRDGPVFVRP